MCNSVEGDFADTEDGAAFHRAYDRVLAKWPVEVTGLDVPTRYGLTRVTACGPPEAPPVVLLPGAGATSTVWFANVGCLAEHFRVLAVDLVGDPGRSVAGETRMRSVEDLMSWFDDVVQVTGPTEFDLVGHSYGAMIALAYALREPRRVRKLVLLDPNSCFAGMRKSYLARAVPLLVRPTATRQRTFVRWETDDRALDSDWLDLLVRGATTFPRSRPVVPQRPTRRALRASTVDTTAIFAAGSKVHDSRRVVEDVRDSLPNVSTVVIDNATHHTLPMSPAAEVNDALLHALRTR